MQLNGICGKKFFKQLVNFQTGEIGKELNWR
jgi:hypothetical protein